MQQSNSYIIIFVLVLCVLIGGLLAGASWALAPAQKKSLELETKSQILSAVGNLVDAGEGTEVLNTYKNRISSIVVNYSGERVTKNEEGAPLLAENVDVAANAKKDPKQRLYPVFRLLNADDTTKIDAYILPVYGNGLWDKIWGYVALGSNVETIVGTSFDHKGETPGLGARIATQEIQDRFIGKDIYDKSGNIVSVTMQKGEHGGGQASIEYYKDQPHEVDGMSGATLTGKGLNAMLQSYLESYRGYFKKVKAQHN